MHLFVVTRGYPSEERLYNHGFVHRRVLAYRERGIRTTVFWLRRQKELTRYSYDGVDVMVGPTEACLEEIEKARPDAVAAHAPADDFGDLFRALAGKVRTVGWIYGSEIMPFFKVTERETDDAARWDKARATFERRVDFWRDFLSEPDPGFTLAFVSHYARATAEHAVGFPIRNSVVLPSPIDTDLYAYEPKPPEQRFEILSVRPFSDWRYANDLSVAAILDLRDHPRFADMHFRFVGTGHLFERTLSPIRDLPNVTCEESFVPQQEIARLHRGAGIFLCPTRDDAQGVARDEAMSSGLVVATNRVAAIPEFADDDCAILAPPEDAFALARGIARLVDEPAEFERRSHNAAMRIRATIAMELVIPRELELLAGSSA